MASAIATSVRSFINTPVPCEVLNAFGQWVAGYELLRFCDDGLLLIRSSRTGNVRKMPLESWRDPVEEFILGAATGS